MALQPGDDAQTQASIAFKKYEEVFKTCRTLIRTCGFVLSFGLVAFFGSRAFGKNTSVGFDWAVHLGAHIEVAASFALTGTAAVWAFVERTLRKRTVSQLSPYKEAYERSKDPNRSGSGLTTSGTTNPGDAGR